MNLMPEHFWSLSLPEFLLKHAAFVRAEDRARALMMEHALMVGHIEKKRVRDVQRAIKALRRYPVKRWLRSA